MKKALSVILAALLAVSLCACTSKEAQSVIDQINSIGTVTLESGDDIKAAEDAYAALEEKDAKQVNNYETLTADRDKYTQLVEENRIKIEAEKIEKQISSIGNVTLNDECKTKISGAEKAYDAADDAVKNAITNYETLTAAKETYDNLLDEEYTAQAAEIDKQIENIGEVTLSSEDKIKKARDAYNAADSAVWSKVSKYDDLIKAESKLKGLKKKEAESKLSSSFYKENDEVQNAIFYSPNCMPEYVDTRSYVLPYLGISTSGNYSWVVIRWNYTGDDWVFYDSVTIVTDTKTYTCSFNYFNILHDNEYGNVWETYDQTTVSSSDLEMLKDMANSGKTTVRFNGKHYYYDLVMNQTDKNAIKDVLDVYNALNE